jgi:hopanoid biosynthesis associated RND transporter like protein HpnN
VAAVADGLHGHPGIGASHTDRIRAGLADLVARVSALAKDLSTPMLSLVIANVVAFCTRHVWSIILAAAVLAGGCGTYAARHFVINADVTKLISDELPWRQREHAYQQVFTHGTQLIAAVVDAPTPELATAAAQALVGKLSTDHALFRSVESMGTNEFFVRNRFLYLPTEEVAGFTGQLSKAAPLMSQLAGDPSLRGLVSAMSLALSGVDAGQVTLDAMTRPFNMSADTIEKVLAGEPSWFSWYVLLNGQPATISQLRRVVTIKPVLDFHALQPGQKATDGVREAARELDLAGRFGATVRLTGPVPIADEEFGTLKEGAVLNGVVTLGVVLLILWLALKSYRIILAVSINLFVGLAITAAVGLALVGSLNLISVAFAVLFVGLGVDFGLQYSVRYRNERHDISDLRKALETAGARAGAPLTLAAAATAAGFLSFLPTDYRGLSELGLIAGLGMVIAFLTSITLLPALLQIFNPPGEPEPLGYAALAPVDKFLEDHRVPVIVGTLLVAIAGLPLLMNLRFDFNPTNLRSPKAESIATYLDLRRDPNVNAHSAQVLAPNVEAADAIAKQLAARPEVARTMTIDSFVPTDQAPKLERIRAAETALRRALNPPALKPAPTDAETVAALRGGAQALREAAEGQTGEGAKASLRLADDLIKLADAGPAQRTAVATAMVEPLRRDLAELRTSLQAGPVTRADVPAAIAREWVAPDGQARVEAGMKGDSNDNEAIRAFARAVLATAPGATGEAIGILESGETIVHAFLQAGAWALVSISILLWVVLRRIGDVLLTLVPLLLAGVVTLEICALIDFPLNFANIIALPLLLGVGVAFKIYYVMAWRAGQTSLLQSSLTRAVFFSAMTTATAFGSLWFSSHPGTSSMGKLLALSLVCTLAAAVLFQPALMGKPRDTSGDNGIVPEPTAAE